MAFVLLKDLALAQQHCKIRTRVSRIWESTTPLLKNDILSLDCLLIDEEGYAMQATVRKYDAEHFRSLLSEGDVYTFENFNVVPSRNNYKVVDRKYMVQISKWTHVLKANNDIGSIPLYSFCFISFEHVKAKKFNNACLIDVLGSITAIAPVSHTYVAQDRTAIRKLEIRDLHFLKTKATDRPVAIVLASMTIRTYRDNIYLSTCSASRLYTDLEIPEVLTFKDNLCSKQTSPVAIHRMEFPNQPLLSPIEQMNTNRKTIAELIKPNLFEAQGVKYTCNAKLVSVDPTYGWWYKACYDCKGAVKDYGDTFWCSQCGKNDHTPIPWYKLNAIVEDETGTAYFTIFGKVAQDLLHVPAQQLVITNNSDRFVLPPVVENIIGQSYIFQIVPDNRKLSTNTNSFRVAKIFNPVLAIKGKNIECDSGLHNIEEEIVESTIAVTQIDDIVEEISPTQLPQILCAQSNEYPFKLKKRKRAFSSIDHSGSEGEEK